MRYHCSSIGLGGLLTLIILLPASAYAHCDGLDGPVVKAAERALESGDVKAALAWVTNEAEGEITAAFEKTLAVRKLSPEAKELADRYFFETVVRVHRAGEGEPYTGLKPAGRDLGPAIPAADKAIETGSAQPVVKLISQTVAQGVELRFSEATEAKVQAAKNPDDVEKARHYVKAYVTFIHYVERLYDSAASSPDHGHSAEKVAVSQTGRR